MEESYWFDHYSFFSNHHYNELFKDRLLTQNLNECLWDEIIYCYFKQTDYKPFWTDDGIQEELINTYLTYLENIEYHGLSASHFHYDTIATTLNTLKSLKVEDENSFYQMLYRLELSLMRSYLSYVNAIQFGLTDPVLVNGGKWFFNIRSADTLSIINTLNALDSLSEFLQFIQPKSRQYLALQNEMSKWLSLKDSLFEPLPIILLDSGSVDSIIIIITQRLHLKGFVKDKYSISDTFNAAFLSALNFFRENNAIPVSSRLDEQTITALNRSVQYYIDKISVNLERLRWQIVPQKGSLYAGVNIADFSLTFFSDSIDFLKMKVCCGSTDNNAQSTVDRTEDGIVMSSYWETPMLYGEIDHLILNPQWYVPDKITEEEYFHQLVAHPDAFLEKEKMFIVNKKNNKPILPDSIEWSKISRKNFPYRLVQKSGRFNALGIIKFDFLNSESVYLHDTPNKRGFQKSNRAITHGCIRLQQPIALAKRIFELNDFDDKEIEFVMIDFGEKPLSEEGLLYLEEKELKEEEYYNGLSEGEKLFYHNVRPKHLHLKKKLPLYIEYFTCFVDDNDQIQYREDVYYKDVSLLNQLKK